MFESKVTTDPFDQMYQALWKPKDDKIVYIDVTLQQTLAPLPGATTTTTKSDLRKIWIKARDRVAPLDEYGIVKTTPALTQVTCRLDSACRILTDDDLRKSVEKHQRIAVIHVEPSMGPSRLLCAVDTAEQEHFSGYG